MTDPSQATMSGTYSDTLTFTFDLVKQCVTYTINVYEQKLEINNRNNTPHVTATNRVDDATGQLTDANSKPKETYVLEYGCANAWGMPLETAVTSEVWTRPDLTEQRGGRYPLLGGFVAHPDPQSGF